MDPVIDFGSNAIEIVPQNQSDIHPGDIISYNNTRGDAIIHRVLRTGEDEFGWYAITKGDNAQEADKERIILKCPGKYLASRLNLRFLKSDKVF